jgi:glycerol-3-phosphate dehydrogenase
MYDVIIIGAGIIGATMARELARYQLDVLVVDKNYDVAMEATMANSAIVHSGHDPRPGTLKARFNVEGNRMYPTMCEELDIPFVRTGGLVVATNPDQEATLHVLRDQAIQNGLTEEEARLIDRQAILAREPNIADSVTMALDLPTTAITFPWEAAIANLENAIDNGVELLLECEVLGIQKEEHFQLKTSRGTYESTVVINAAGIHADEIMGMYTTPHFAIHPRRGEYYVLDRDVYDVTSVIYPVPDEKGKGVLITPQYHGNVLIGPTSEEVAKSEVHRTTPSGLEYIKRHAAMTMKNIPYDKVIRSFAGGRASSTQYDFIIEDVNQSGFINLAGIESPGLTAAPAIPPYVVDTFLRHHLTLKTNPTFQPRRRRVPRLNEIDVTERNKMVSEDPSYGKMVCRCEGITEGEIRDVIRRSAGARSVVGVKNRSRAGAGRCQGGFCQSDVIRILAEELGIDKQQVNYSKSNTPILRYETKGNHHEDL